jgi:hypothetical protein
MAGNITNYLETRLLDHSINNVDTGASGVEVSGGSYARVNVLTGNAGGHFFGSAASADPSTSSNAADIVFPTATANWGTIVGVGILDSTTTGAGNLLWVGNLTASKVVNTGDVFKFLTGQLVLTLD